MTEIAPFPTQETYQHFVTATQEFNEIHSRLVSDLAEQNLRLVNTWWRQQTAHVTALPSAKDVAQLLEKVQKGTAEDLELLQKHFATTLEALRTGGKGTAEWYDKQLTNLSKLNQSGLPTPLRSANKDNAKAA